MVLIFVNKSVAALLNGHSTIADKQQQTNVLLLLVVFIRQQKYKDLYTVVYVECGPM